MEELIGLLFHMCCSCGIEGGVFLRRGGLVGFGGWDCAQMWSVRAGMRTDVAFVGDWFVSAGEGNLKPAVCVLD